MPQLSLVVLLSGAIGPPPPVDALEGDIVEVGGILYMVHDGKLYTLDDPVLDDPSLTMTVTGSRVDTQRGNKNKVVRVETVDSTAIAESGARTLGDVLEEQAGITVNSSLGLGQEVQLDGLDGRHVLVLIDGRPVNGKVNNRVDVSRLPVSAASIDRVEIVRGPMSALYGSEALGGVVNIVTKDPALLPYVELELGMQWLPVAPGAPLKPWKQVGLHAGGGVGPVALRFDVTGADQPGFDRGSETPDCSEISTPAEHALCVASVSHTAIDFARTRPDGKGDLPERRSFGMHAEAALPILDDFEFRAALDGSQSETLAILSQAPFSDRARNSEWSASALLAADAFDDAEVEVDLRVSRFNHIFDKLPGGAATPPRTFCSAGGLPFDAPCPAPPDLRTDATLAESRLELRYTDPLIAEVPFVDELTLSAGAVASRQQARRRDGEGNDTIAGGGDRNTLSLYGELLYKPWPWLSVVPGGRVDAYTPSEPGQEAAFGPKIALRANLPFDTALRASYGRGFRLPSFEERLLFFDHSELGYIILGSPTLAPESSHGVRAEALWDPSNEVSLGAEIYLNVVDDLISERITDQVDEASGAAIYTYENVARAYTSGINLRTSLGPFFGFKADVAYQYLINAVDSSNCPEENAYFCGVDEGARSLPLRAPQSLDTTVRYKITSTETTLFVKANALDTRVIDESEGRYAPAYVKLGVGVRQTLFDTAEIIVGLENLFDAYDPVFGPKPGRHATISLRIWEK